MANRKSFGRRPLQDDRLPCKRAEAAPSAILVEKRRKATDIDERGKPNNDEQRVIDDLIKRLSMNADSLKAIQSPLKDAYRTDPGQALITLRAIGDLSGDGIACKVDTGRALVHAGLHPATGGDGSFACSGDMLLEALAACAGVTLKAVATASRAISIFAARSVSPRMLRSASSRSGSPLRSTRVSRKNASIHF
jgi:hypothetical protein